MSVEINFMAKGTGYFFLPQKVACPFSLCIYPISLMIYRKTRREHCGKGSYYFWQGGLTFYR